MPVPPDPQGEGGLGQGQDAAEQGGQEGVDDPQAGEQGGQEGAHARGPQEFPLDRAVDAGRPHGAAEGLYGQRHLLLKARYPRGHPPPVRPLPLAGADGQGAGPLPQLGGVGRGGGEAAVMAAHEGGEGG